MQEIFAAARKFMRENGNPNQWADDYPGEALLGEDIASGDSYLIQSGGIIVATFVLKGGEDPTYKEINGGAWPNALLYATIHRIASSGATKGVLHAGVDFALQSYPAIRIDTHRDNTAMRMAIAKEGFEYCGIIRCWNGSEHLAYQLTGQNLPE
ncbi:MAG: GNAT family N-acetyltransferase [Candidatus Cryptobacteroides sp.]